MDVFRFLLKSFVAVVSGTLLACTGGQKGDPIVLPSGQLIEYSNSAFVDVAKTYYTMELLRFDPASKKFYSVGDLTPTENKDLAQSIRHIIPKIENKSGLYIVRASLAVQGVNLTALVTKDDMVLPSLASTLLVELVTKYPKFDVQTVTDDTVRTLTAEIEKAILRAQKEFDVSPLEFTYRAWYRFLQNYVARDQDFLELADEKGFSFTVDSSGMVSSEPYPFGVQNTPPDLDAGNSTPTGTVIQGRENSKLTLKGRGNDAEADVIIYRWYRNGVFQSKDPITWDWTPGFDAANGEIYKVTLKISDGGIPREVLWDVNILDYNRPPELTQECTKDIEEGKSWSCTIQAMDFDGDPISFTVADRSTSARVLVNGQKTNDTTRVLTVASSEIKLEITPNNNDAKKRNMYLEVSASDGKLGVTSLPLNVGVKDINSPPEIIFHNGSAIKSMIDGTVAHEWDYCANEDPDGIGPYRFMIEVRDPDNQAAAHPRNLDPDQVTVNFGGSLKEALTVVSEAEGCPLSSSEKSFFCFEWKPHHSPKTGTLTLTLKDDHGGIAQIPSPSMPQPITLTAEDRNVRPCLKSRAQNQTLSDNISMFTDEMGGEDEDETSPWPELVNVPMPVIPLLSSDDPSQKSLIFRRTLFNPSEWVMRFPNAGLGPSAAAYGIWLKRPLSGLVTFTRATGHSTSLSIVQGTLLNTSTITPKIQYEVAQTVTMEPDDLAVTVPVRAVGRDVPAGKLNRFITPVAGVSVTNTSLLSGSGVVALSRVSSATELSIPAGTEFGTSELADGTDTVRYQSLDNVVFNVGVNNLNIRVRRLALSAAIGTVTQTVSATWPGPALTITNPVPLADTAQYTLMRDLQKGITLNVDRFCWNRRVADSGEVAGGTELKAATSLPADVHIATQGTVGLNGEVKITRTNTTSALTLNAGQILRPLDRSQLAVLNAVTLPAGVSQATAKVVRTGHYNPTPLVAADQQICIGWTDTNYEPSFLNATGFKVPEGGSVLDFEINVTDNRASPQDPNDFLDRHTFTNTVIGAPPEGGFAMCREPGNDVGNILLPACTPCTNTNGTYFEASSCYFRFKPALNDVSQVFSFNITVNDNGLDYPVGTNIRNQSINVSVIENNDPPSHTDINGALLTNTTVDSSLYLGEFVEGVESRYRMYFSDPDRGTELKTLIAPTLVKTWQFISPLGWLQRTNPTGMVLELTAPSTMNSNGWGSKTIAQIRWKPNDNDAKRFAGTAGIVFEISACDLGNVDSPRACRTGFYQVRTRNINNLPSVSAATSMATVAMQADLYQTKNFNVVDTDYATNSTMPNTQSSFYTRLSMCAAPGVYDCAADQTGWPVVLSTFDFPYAPTATNTNCQSGGALTAHKVPQLVLTSVAGSTTATERVYPYSLRWCPQKRHIGNHLVYFSLRDNGDEDFRGPSSLLAAHNVQIPVRLNVVAPVFFESPRRASSGIEAVFWMRQAFSLAEYRYELIINNSRGNKVDVNLLQRAKAGTATIGNPVLETRSYAAPTVVAASNASVISNLDLKTHRIFLVWRPYGATTTTPYFSTADTNTWPLFQLKVTDKTTGENETVQFRVQVKDPISPLNVPPMIDSAFPAVSAVSIVEQVPQTFSIVASDGNSDPLTYRWYLDGKLMSDAGPSYTYLPGMEDAFLPAATPGLHTLTVQVVDGQERAANPSLSWQVRVRNTVPFPMRMTYANAAFTPWTFAQSVIERGYTGGITNLLWGPTVGAATTTGSNTLNHLIFTGSYSRASVVRHFVWRLQFANTKFDDNNPSSSAQGTEVLPWAVGKKSEQISFTQDAGVLKSVLVSSAPNPLGPFAGTGDAVTLATNLGSLASLTPTNACTGSCTQNFFQNFASQESSSPAPGFISSAGTTASAGYMASSVMYYFFSSEEATILNWSRASSGVMTPITSLTGNDRIGDIAVNPATHRLYMTVRDPAALRNFIYIYDIYGIHSGTVTLLRVIPVTDGVTPDNRILDLAIDRTKNRIYALLPGTGGVVSFIDNGGAAPDASDLQFIGVAQISSSYTDEASAGRKLVFNPNTELLYGLAKDANEVFIIDTKNDAFTTKVFRADVPLDEILTFSNDGLTVAINRAQGLIYLVR